MLGSPLGYPIVEDDLPDAREDVQGFSSTAPIGEVTRPQDQVFQEEVESLTQLVEEHNRVVQDTGSTPELFEALSPAGKIKLLELVHVGEMTGTNESAWHFVDWNVVPSTIHCHWLSPNVIGHLGARGYMRTPNNAQTRKWAPNARQMTSSRYIIHGNMILGYKAKSEWLATLARQHKDRKDRHSAQDPRFSSAFRSVAGSLGMSRAQAEELDRLSPGGMIAHRGPDPFKGGPDYTKGVGEE
jgi:hypothetical protein